MQTVRELTVDSVLCLKMGKYVLFAILFFSSLVTGNVISRPPYGGQLKSYDNGESESPKSSWYRTTSEENDDLRLLGVRKEEVPVLLELYYLVKVLQAYRDPNSWGSYNLNGAIERITDKEVVEGLEKLLKRQRAFQEISLIGAEGTVPDPLQVQLANDERLLYPFLIRTLRKVLGLKKTGAIILLDDKDDFLGALLLDMQQEWQVLRAVRVLKEDELGGVVQEVPKKQDKLNLESDNSGEDTLAGVEEDGTPTKNSDLEKLPLDPVVYNVEDPVEIDAGEDIGNLMFEGLPGDAAEETSTHAPAETGHQDIEDQARRDHNRGSQHPGAVLIIQQTTTVTESPPPRPAVRPSSPLVVYKPAPSSLSTPTASQLQVNQIATQADKVAIDLIASELDKFIRVVEELSGVDDLSKQLDLFDRTRMVGWIKQSYVPTVGLDQRDFIRAMQRLLKTKPPNAGRRDVLDTLQYLKVQLDRDDRTKADVEEDVYDYFKRVYGDQKEGDFDVRK